MISELDQWPNPIKPLNNNNYYKNTNDWSMSKSKG